MSVIGSLSEFAEVGASVVHAFLLRTAGPRPRRGLLIAFLCVGEESHPVGHGAGAQPMLVLTGKGLKTADDPALPIGTLIFPDLAAVAGHITT